MNRLTHQRVNGIKQGYWTAAKKDELVERLAAYEDIGLTPEEIENLKGEQELSKTVKSRWTCRDCMHFVGAGDWNLCCGLKPGLCYRDTPACNLFEPMPEPFGGEQE